MLISPPFLPPRAANQSDEDWINTAMSGGTPGDGAFPVSHNLGWHGGLHLTAPSLGNGFEPVRAIADGTVVFLRKPSSGLPNLPPTHALMYNGATSDGVVVIKHETEIGEGTNASVTFYSIYMHLHEIFATVKTNGKVYRKDTIGRAGYINGVNSKIHFEIICDDANLTKLVGRASGNLNITRDGRTDAIYGEMYFQLPAGTQVFAQKPLPNHVQAMMQPPGQPAPVPQAIPVAYTTTSELFVGLRYAGGEGAAGNRGDAYLTTYQPDATLLGAALNEHDAEYDLYTTANKISQAYPATGRPAPSAVYELLRFGRVIGPDALVPANVPHWRQIRYPGGQGWVNLNAVNVHKFSDADFPHWRGWQLVDDSADQDSRCDSATIRGWLDVNQDGKVNPGEATARLADNTIAAKLARTICKTPTEWNAVTIDARWGWLKTQTIENPQAMTNEDFEKLKAHITALAFWPGGTGMNANHWHFQPREFIRHFRMCGWLSEEELAGTFPKYLFYNTSGNPRTAITTNNATYTMTRTRARAAISNHQQALNRCIRKYVGSNPQRIAIFLAQVMLETAQWRNLGGTRRLMHEWGFGAFSSANPATQYYTAFYGRGIMQLTWAGNYKNYGEFRQLLNHAGAYSERLPNHAPRITATSQHYDFNPSDNGVQFRWSPRYDPDIVGEQAFEACDSGGFYWVSKPFSEGININRVADRAYNESNIGFVNRLVNGGGNGYYERQAYTAFMLRMLNDSVAISLEQMLTPPSPKTPVRANMSRVE